MRQRPFRNMFVTLAAGTLLAAWPVNAGQPTPRRPGPPAPPATIETPPATQPDAATPLVVKVFKLRYANPERIMAALQVAGRPGPMRCVADRATSAVIVSATPEQFPVVADLISQLDQPDSSGLLQPDVRIFRLNNASAGGLVDILSRLVPGGTFAVDKFSNSLLASGSKELHLLTEGIVQELDRAPIAPAQKSRQVRFVWLIGGMELPAPPADLGNVVDELKDIGVEDLGLAAQSVVQTLSNGKFNVQSSPATFSNCQVNIKGSLQETGNSPPRLDLTLSASGSMPQAAEQPSVPLPPRPMPGVGQLTSFETSLVAPPGRKVVLGVTPIGRYTSVFVIQILGGSEAGK